MKLFERKRKNESSEVAVTGVSQLYNKKFSSFGGVSENFSAEKQLYENLRKSVPVIDGAISKIVRLTGGFRVNCSDMCAQQMLGEFLKNVNVGGNMCGIDSFVSLFLDQLLTYGTAVGEMVLNPDNRSFSLYNGELDNIVLERNKRNPMTVDVCTSDSGTVVPVKNPHAVIMSVLDPDAGKLHGKSVLRGLPFVSAVLLQIFETIGTNWDRVGNLRYAVTYKPQNDALDKAYAKERAMQIAKGWSEAMKSGGEVKDFIAVGDVDIRVIGADNQILNSEIPVRQILEQIVAKLGLPPFMLGLNWSTSERMAQQQSDILTSELWHYRRILTPVIEKICRMFLRMNALDTSFSIEWEDISLLDETEQAKANYYNAQAEKYKAEATALGKEN